jgi:hypothetical protein
VAITERQNTTAPVHINPVPVEQQRRQEPAALGQLAPA